MIDATHHSRERNGFVTAGVWLVALGAVFLVQQYTRWPWADAWPLFVIMVGVAGTVTSLLWARYSPMGIWGLGWPIALTIVGVLLLLVTTRSIDMTLTELVRWWPVAVIALGVWFLVAAVFARTGPGADTETLALPLDGRPSAEIRLNFGGGELVVGQAQPGMLVSGTFEGGVRVGDRRGQIYLRPLHEAWPFAGWGPLHWNVGLTADIPLDLRLDTGANRSTIDTSGLRVRRLELHSGASETTVRLPASGATYFRAETGLASLRAEVPEGVAARIRSKMGLGSTQVDETRFPRSFDGWASPDYETSANRVEIDIQGGLGSVRVA